MGSRNGTFLVRFSDAVQIEIVFLALGQEKNVLMLFGETVFDAFRHAVRLRPDNVIAYKPSPCHAS